MRTEKVSWPPIKLIWAYGKTSIISCKISGGINITHRYGKQVAIEILNPRQYKKMRGVWKPTMI